LENGAQERKELQRAVVVDCRACRTVCEEALAALLDSGRVDRDASVIRSLMNAAAIAETAASWLDEERHVATGLLEFCADACETAAAEVEAVVPDDLVRQCAQVCRATADSVRALLWAAFEAGDV
jgi:hypothetical protein